MAVAASQPAVVTVVGIVMDVRPVAQAKAWSPISVTVDGIVIFLSDVHLLNILSARNVKLLPKSTLSSAVQL